MAAMQIARGVVVDRHIDDVFEYVADRGNDPAWWPNTAAVRQIGGDGPGPGARYELTRRRAPRRVLATCVAWEPPVRVAFREDDGASATVVAYELASVWTSTRVTRAEDRAPGRPLARRRRAREARAALDALVRALERA
jgi:uncharacterized protein YndB with AHSA1/START domain